MNKNFELKVRHHAGFFSCMSVRLARIIKFFNTHKRCPDGVDSSRLFGAYKNHPDDDISSMFLDTNELDVTFNSEVELNSNKVTKMQFTDYRKLDFQTINPFVIKYFKPSKLVNARKEELIQKYDIQFENLIACYYRGTDKCKETNIPEWTEFINKVKEIRANNPTKKLLLLTDEIHRVSEFEATFKNTIPLTELIHEHVERGNIHAQYLFALALIISKAKIIVCGSGNVSYWVALYRGHGEGIHQYLSPKISKADSDSCSKETCFWLSASSTKPRTIFKSDLDINKTPNPLATENQSQQIPKPIRFIISSGGGVATTVLSKFFKLHPKDKFKHYPEPPKNKIDRAIFVIGEPSEQIQSIYNRKCEVRGKEWQKHHCKTMQGDHEKMDPNWSISDYLRIDTDLFLFERQFDNWTRKSKPTYPILVIKYHTIWENLSTIFDFVGWPEEKIVDFPKKRKRNPYSPLTSEDKMNLERLYGTLGQKYAALPDIFIRPSSCESIMLEQGVTHDREFEA